MSHLVQEPLATTIKRGTGVMYCEIVGGCEPRFLDTAGYALGTGEHPRDIRLDEGRLRVAWPRPLRKNDSVAM